MLIASRGRGRHRQFPRGSQGACTPEMQPGDLLAGRYDLQRPLGEGGMAQVWEARDRHLDRMVAVKVIDDALTRDPGFLVRFFSEAQAVARINHPNVIGILDFGEVDGRPYLVLEQAEGGTVSDIVERAPVAPATAARLIAGAAAGAGAAHDVGVVHRDIKPSNVLVDQRGEPQLADFGIASTTGGEDLTATGAALGSPHYISPEQAQDIETTPTSDVYSLGIVLYQLLTGRLPFDGSNATAIAIAHVEKRPDPPSMIVETVPPDLEAIVLKCLEKDPAARFSDGRALAIALAAWLTRNEVAAVTPNAESRSPFRVTTKNTAVAAVAVLLIVLSAFAVAVPSDGGSEVSLPQVGFEGGLPEGASKSPSPTPTDEDATAEIAPTASIDDVTEEEQDDARSEQDRDRRPRQRGRPHRPTNDNDEPEPETSPTPTETEPADASPQPSPSPTAEQYHSAEEQESEPAPPEAEPQPAPSSSPSGGP
ncbi:MAG TPA: protein kinase [Actinomycetota bacterium]|nr:protein kinase [Actinomycetota bacterium]